MGRRGEPCVRPPDAFENATLGRRQASPLQKPDCPQSEDRRNDAKGEHKVRPYGTSVFVNPSCAARGTSGDAVRLRSPEPGVAPTSSGTPSTSSSTCNGAYGAYPLHSDS